jgi:membrane protease YdiL (CAAX protease family)
MTSSKQTINVLAFKRVQWLSPAMQIGILLSLYAFTGFLVVRQVQLNGSLFSYPLLISVLFAPLYEEIVFRGWILTWLLKKTEQAKAIVITSFLSALWVMANILQWNTDDVIRSMFVTGLIVSPFLCFLTINTKTIWPGVIIHYIINLLAGLSFWVIVALLILI